jgi:hypothetical protein
MIAKNSKPSEEEVILAFSGEPIYDRNTLERYLGEYPEYAKAIVDCSIELMVSATRQEETPVASDSSIDLAWQRFQAAVGVPESTAVTNPFAKLNRTAFKVLAEKLDINNLLLIRLRDRAIDAATIPRCFVQKLAAALGADAEAVTAYLRNPPGIVSSHSFRSSVKPAVTEQISFEKAVETSQLTQAQQDALKALGD